eukprot:TRINITY_DN1002_c0_g2_i1.p1 TRINITY_DN1002_c0_g2~~TRINITY_DN1002_c0_g2_i1.p1  ORF type:complete len:215 (+),score=42.14 TRINITY_DN1002_c0_g2_i1:70-714(+)
MSMFSADRFEKAPGGFMTDQSTGHPVPSPSAPGATPGTPGDEGKKQNTSLTPVTCRMILRAEKGGGEVFKIDGKILHQVALVAKLIDWNLSENGREVLLTVSDGTGSLQITVFGTDFLPELERWKTNRYDMANQLSYMRIFGHVRSWNKGIAVVAFKIAFCEHILPEIIHHQNMVVHSYLCHKNGSLEKLESEMTSNRPPVKQQYGTQPGGSAF